MRAAWLAMILALAPIAASAQEARELSLPRLCAEGPPRSVRFASAPAAAADITCRANMQGDLQSCAVIRAAPDTEGVRYIALQQLCFEPRRDPATLTPGADGALRAEISLSFSIECSRAGGMQMCNTGPAREGETP